MPLALPTPMPAQLPTQLPEFETAIQLASGNDAAPNSVVSAIATSADRQPSIVKIPALKVDLPVVQNQTAQDMATSRSIGAKVRLSAGSFITSDAVNSGVASLPGQSNSANIKVTRSGDITAETPVKLSFNADQVVALPAFPSANSPYAKSGIEIPVRVETVTNTINTLPSSNNSIPSIVPLPTLELPTLTPPVSSTPASSQPVSSPSEDLPNEPTVNTVDELATETPSLTPEMQQDVTDDEQVTTENESVAQDSDLSNESENVETQVTNTNERSDETTAAPELPSNITPLPLLAQPVLPTALSGSAEPVPTNTEDLSSKVGNTPAPIIETLPTKHPLPAPSATTNTVVAAPIMSGLPSSLPSQAEDANPNQSATQISSGIPVTTGPLVITLGSTQMDADRAEKMQVESQAMRALQTKGSISKIHIVDGSVCRVVANGNRLFVVGDQPGETLVEVSTDNGAKPTYVKVCVVKPWQQASKSSVAVDQLASIVSHLVPDADVEVQPQADGSLLVKGMVETKEQAKKIVSSIRKMVLVPVVDALEIR